MRFAPTVFDRSTGQTHTPEGWEWILGFALGGCEWAIVEANKPEFRSAVRVALMRRDIASWQLEAARLEDALCRSREKIEELERKIALEGQGVNTMQDAGK